ncbi:glycosyltransferase involved in cell wall biosynthesis [Algoriphagus zhangzhouensis]|uniref:Glycosyltransferase involved in cell wall bisynthesis n=1 Tax=Algoriphagus zhangzhouensis TaxID=1073327 RepID=A0A1M7ZKD7_9BACT|nr:glycosyltransferase involved in cell wall biosynthesis [Algoriphagus zhangzhouensis]SHO65380.1 Glycosyltransferase involved in cell wall bisynthesis [Algoriphagus zhangzhouensis]
MKYKEKIRVGTIGLSYNHKKNFFGLIPNRVSYFKVLDFISPYRVLMRNSTLKRVLANSILKNIHFAPFQRKVDLFHFFNTISFSNTPWITTFETFLPRWGMDEMGIKRICSESCKGIVAMSFCANDIMLQKVKEEFPDYFDAVASKVQVIHPSQKPIVNSWEEKGINVREKIIFTLVGNDFFRKGGTEVLKVFKMFINKGANLELRIISNLKFGDYASKTSKSDQNWAFQFISEYSNHIKHYQNISNSEVLELLKSTHVGLLPTYADTYGYSVLEMQAMACPVISTNIRALPEINSNERGWIIEVPKDKYGEGKYNSKEERELLSSKIENGLGLIFDEILNNPNIIIEKGQKALNGLKILNCPKTNGDAYFSIYKNTLEVED